MIVKIHKDLTSNARKGLQLQQRACVTVVGDTEAPSLIEWGLVRLG